MRNWKPFLGLFLIGVAASVDAQERESVPTFRVTAEKVLIEFIAVDSKGRFVNDLLPEEVELFVDGKKQTLESLLAPDFLPEREEGRATREPDSGPRDPVETRQAGGSREVSTGGPRSAAAQTAIVLDKRVFDAANFARSIAAVRQFIQQSSGDDHLMLIAEIDRGLKIVAPFSNDPSVLLQALGSLRPSSVYSPLDPSRLNARGVEGTFNRQRYYEFLGEQLAHLQRSLQQLCYSLSGVPGRKHVVFFSEGYPFHSSFHVVREVVATANSFGISINTVDARGLIAAPGIGSADIPGNVAAGPGDLGQTYQSSEKGLSEVQLGEFQVTMLNRLSEAKDMLIALAAGTNGSAFYNTNDLGAVLRAAALEQRNSYIAAFVPQSLQTKEDGFHRVKVRSSRPGILIRSQTGYREDTQQEASFGRLALALTQPDFFQYLKPTIQTLREGADFIAVLGIPGEQIQSRPVGSEHQIEIRFVGQIFDRQGQPVSDAPLIWQDFNIVVEGDQLEALSAQPLLMRQKLDLPRGRYRLTTAVEDRVGGTLGAASREFTVP